MPAIVEIDKLSFSYGSRKALDQVSLSVQSGEIFGLLGPNGGGKTTLFRILCTLLPSDDGSVSLLGKPVSSSSSDIRKQIGVIFQSPSLDKKLTVWENLWHQGHLYGLSGEHLTQRMSELLERVKLTDRAHDTVEKLSGGLQRRVDVAKALLHQPRLLLLDEPSTGLDPGARKDLWDYLSDLKSREGITILVTTHLMEEAERCDRLGILNQGKLIALGTPQELRTRIGGEVIIAKAQDPQDLCQAIKQKFGGEPQIFHDTIRWEQAKGHEFIARLVEAFPGKIDSVTIGRPTLEDVFIHLTGHRFWGERGGEA
jgi:ABC-2 type transport system ATP-binding protein